MMNDLESRKEPVPTKVLAKQGVSAVGQIAGGALLLIMHVFSARLPPLGIILGIVAGGLGISGYLSKDPDDKKPGIVLAVAGALKLVFHIGPSFIRPLAGTFLTVASLGLLGLGLWNGVRFLMGLKSRKQGS